MCQHGGRSSIFVVRHRRGQREYELPTALDGARAAHDAVRRVPPGLALCSPMIGAVFRPPSCLRVTVDVFRGRLMCGSCVEPCGLGTASGSGCCCAADCPIATFRVTYPRAPSLQWPRILLRRPGHRGQRHHNADAELRDHGSDNPSVGHSRVSSERGAHYTPLVHCGTRAQVLLSPPFRCPATHWRLAPALRQELLVI